MVRKTAYYAKRLSDGSVLRVSADRATVGLVALGMLQPIIVVVTVALILSAVLASRLSKRIVEPINSIDLEHPLDNDIYEELSPLLNRINRQGGEISAQLRKLNQKEDEFTQITCNMNEGLVLIDNNSIIISINPAAERIFGTDDSCVGKDFLIIDRSLDTDEAIHSAFDNGHSEIRANRNGRVYQFNISRIDSENKAIGAVLLAFDVTEQENAECSRREFTANVSHELKTPLQGIIGSADLIENGMVKSEDMQRFIGHIKREANRLLALIEDIIRLSQLDEGGEMLNENVDLLSVSNEVAENLSNVAKSKNISIDVSGSEAHINGVRRLIYETVFNLCDNALKYNTDGGKVSVNVKDGPDSAEISVSDTGIGIAPEHQARVFERFYRVDKSHSKASGGTGLGLSIVKHAVMYHKGTVDLQSVPGKGTCITVTLPKNK